MVDTGPNDRLPGGANDETRWAGAAARKAGWRRALSPISGGFSD